MMIANSMFSYFKSQFVQRTNVSMLHFLIIFSVLSTLFVEINAVACPRAARHGRPPPRTCNVKDPNHLPKTSLQKWFSRADFDDLFPKANQGWGPHKCLPYSYEAFIIASRYFPEFGTASVVGPTTKSTFTKKQLQRRDVAAFFAHILQETGETDYDLFNSTLSPTEARECFYRGGLYHFYEGGPRSPFFPSTLEVDAVQPNDGKTCFNEGRYCHEGIETATWYPCFNETDLSKENPTDESEGSGEEDRKTYGGCYFGRGPLQLSWNYNYGQFQHFLAVHGIKVDLLANPQLLITKLDPPLAMLSALWFYMTPQPPKPAMHDVIMGNWRSSQKNQRAGYEGSVFGPTSLIINKECHGEDSAEEPGPPGENRRIKAFRWFSDKFNLKIENERLLSCKGMLEPFDAIPHKYSWQPDWSTMWKSQPCDCAPAAYPGALPYYDSKFYPERMVKENDRNRLRCVYNLYKNKEMFRITPENSPCIKHSVKIRLNKDGI